MAKLAFIIFAVFCFLHIYRDYLQIKYGYNSWFTKFGHVWDAPQHEGKGMVVFAILGGASMYLGLR